MNAIYLDNSATTPMLPQVWEAMLPYFQDRPGNAGSSHSFGRQARQALEGARERIAALLDAHPDEVLFTSGATEANNLALFGQLQATQGTVVSSPLEHPSVAEPIRQLKGALSHVSLPVTAEGSVDLAAFTFPDDVQLVSVMLANHETGALQPVASLVQKLQERAPFHCDAAAAAGKTLVSFRKLGVTSLTISAHKFHGPKGIGALLMRRSAKLRPLLWGGHQQHGKRPGTEPIPLAVGMAEALAWSIQNLEANHAKVLALHRRLLDRLRKHAAPVILNGPGADMAKQVPHLLNLSFPGCQADVLLIRLDLAGVACSTGSACTSGSLLPSGVLRAMGLSGDVLQSALRFSLSPLLTEVDVDEAACRIAQCVQRLRQANPGGADMAPAPRAD